MEWKFSVGNESLGNGISVMDDCELLHAFTKQGDESAFERLLQRHGLMVQRTALRRLGNEQASREICQTVFIVLARKAPTIRCPASLGPWLHRVTMLECSEWLRQERRRQRKYAHYQDYLRRGRESVTAPTSTAWVAELDEAIQKLNARDREAIILRFFEGRSFQEIGVVLDLSDDACQKRTSRAVERLANRLRRHRVTIPVLGAALQQIPSESQAAAPLAWLPSGEILSLKPSAMTAFRWTVRLSPVSTLAWLGVGVLYALWAIGWVPSASPTATPPLTHTPTTTVASTHATLLPLLTRTRTRTRYSPSSPDITLETLLDDFIDAYLQGDTDYAKRLQNMIDTMDPADVVNMLDDWPPHEGEAIELLRDLPLKSLITQNPAMVCERAHARRLTDIACYALYQWAQHAPEEALAWHRQQTSWPHHAPGLAKESLGKMPSRTLAVLNKQKSLWLSKDSHRALDYEGAMAASLYLGLLETSPAMLDPLVARLRGKAAYGAAVAVNRCFGRIETPNEILKRHMAQLMDQSEEAL